SSRPAAARRNVDFPVPFAPTTASPCPADMVTLIGGQTALAIVDPYPTLTELAFSSGLAAFFVALPARCGLGTVQELLVVGINKLGDRGEHLEVVHQVRVGRDQRPGVLACILDQVAVTHH